MEKKVYNKRHMIKIIKFIILLKNEINWAHLLYFSYYLTGCDENVENSKKRISDNLKTIGIKENNDLCLKSADIGDAADGINIYEIDTPKAKKSAN